MDSAADPLALIAEWPVDSVAAAIVDTSSGVEAPPFRSVGDSDRPYRLASLSKVMAGWAAMIAVQEAVADLDEVIAPFGGYQLHPGTTLRHLLAHAAGFPFEGSIPVAELEERRIYSNTGIEIAAAVVERDTGFTFEAYLAEAVFEPLQMNASALRGSPAHSVWSTVGDVARFVVELLRPRLLDPVLAANVVTVQYPDLAGIVPGVGSFDPCPWGLGIEIKGSKAPHWMGTRTSPRTAGHFGGAGTMMWADPDTGLGAVALTDTPFDRWAADAVRSWREFSDAICETRGV